ncbi:hypothetical protein GCM10010251_30640 [Streptomyces aurantiogriseus]|uniref:Uncharacterized protein n=1 Tax=Streptomyces aurantiogriseus TaxID=66870 RepID=A0A918C9Z2_9ACTN|nr:hypothetical protein GCM10010251_30640 [Streptomyces aurantiogriseus]
MAGLCRLGAAEWGERGLWGGCWFVGVRLCDGCGFVGAGRANPTEPHIGTAPRSRAAAPQIS